MSHWKERSETSGDVVFFSYVSEGMEKGHDEVFVWDIDKTYLDTKIDSLRGLFGAAVEKALSKKNIPGTTVLLQSLGDYRRKHKGTMYFPIYFISASPPQLEDRIIEKFTIDGIRPFGCFYKDNLTNLRPGRFWRLSKQVGYKLQALLELRLRLSEDVRQICWGDDSESDAIIYNLYSDLCSRRMNSFEARNILERLQVTREQTEVILDLVQSVPAKDPIDKIYINLATDTDPDYYLKFGRRTCATSNTFQVALDLFQDQRIDIQNVWSIFEDMVQRYEFTHDQLMKSLDDFITRGSLGEKAAKEITDFFVEKSILHDSFRPRLPARKETLLQDGRVIDLEGLTEPWVQERIEYLTESR